VKKVKTKKSHEGSEKQVLHQRNQTLGGIVERK
jgi:hypothetical protein